MARRALPSKRFKRYVDYDGPINPKTGTPCHLWTGTVVDGYGVFELPFNLTIAAHRFAYQQVYGFIPTGHFVDHDDPNYGCGNQLCMNAEHMRLLSPFEEQK